MIKYIVLYLTTFICLYVIYYLFVVRRKKTNDRIKNSLEVRYLISKYKIKIIVKLSHQNTPKTNIGVGGENKYVLCTDQLVSQRGGDTPCEVVTIDVNNSIEGKEEEQNTYENKTCSYATMFEYENYGDTTTTLEFEITKNHINTVKVIDNHTVSYDFGVSDLNGECPKVLYSSNVSSDNFSISLQKNSESGYGYITKLGLIKTVTLEDPENLNETTDLCESLGPMEKYVRGAYSIIRFLIPIIIIVLSVIDFAGIVLSGETEKMEKAKKKFVLRLVIGILILFIPALLELLLKLAGVLSDKQTIADAVCGIVL